MVTRVACGLTSDLSNNCKTQIAEYLPKIMPALQSLLTDPKFEPEAKVHAIIAIGDACLASEQNCYNYLGSTMHAFKEASMQSVKKGIDEDIES